MSRSAASSRSRLGPQGAHHRVADAVRPARSPRESLGRDIRLVAARHGSPSGFLTRSLGLLSIPPSETVLWSTWRG
jgi:hypothetical protein